MRAAVGTGGVLWCGPSTLRLGQLASRATAGSIGLRPATFDRPGRFLLAACIWPWGQRLGARPSPPSHRCLRAQARPPHHAPRRSGCAQGGLRCVWRRSRTRGAGWCRLCTTMGTAARGSRLPGAALAMSCGCCRSACGSPVETLCTRWAPLGVSLASPSVSACMCYGMPVLLQLLLRPGAFQGRMPGQGGAFPRALRG